MYIGAVVYVHAHVYVFGHCVLGGVEQKIIWGLFYPEFTDYKVCFRSRKLSCEFWYVHWYIYFCKYILH